MKGNGDASERFIETKQMVQVAEQARCWYDGERCNFQTASPVFLQASITWCKSCNRIYTVRFLLIFLEIVNGHEPNDGLPPKQILEKIYGAKVKETTLAALLTDLAGSFFPAKSGGADYLKKTVAALIELMQLDEEKIWHNKTE